MMLLKLLTVAQQQERKEAKHIVSSKVFCCILKNNFSHLLRLVGYRGKSKIKWPFSGKYRKNNCHQGQGSRSLRTRTAGDGTTGLTHLPEFVEFGEIGDGQQVDVDHAEELQVLKI